ncbi:MAG: DUF262 domain-containing protein, partial [Chloroflexota bacterium]|nr:DUF262 domain-containing protein [Chloroflexota bacterium]
MSDITPRSESILGIIKDVTDGNALLPEFQRDFRWELERTYDLFDSLAKDIFIGTIIYGKPSFAISCRRLDTRPRRGKGSRAKLQMRHFDENTAQTLGKSHNFRLILDGQQRITAIHRAITGVDSVYMIHSGLHDAATLDEMVEDFAGVERSDRISIKLGDVYKFEMNSDFEQARINVFKASRYFKENSALWNDSQETDAIRMYLKGCQQLSDLFKREKLISYYLLDMSLDKFCLFFERSNSRGIQLNFTDILAAKLYSGFNLRESIEKFEDDHPNILPNRELIIRAISYFSSSGREIDKGYILKNLRPEDFNRHWDEVCSLYVRVLNFLYNNRFMLSQKWLPSENMVLPLIVFFRELAIRHRSLDEMQNRFLSFWYWSSVFANRYTGASNEVMLEDSRMLRGVARRDYPNDSSY